MIGSLGGDLAVFKLQQARPYLCCRGLGTVRRTPAPPSTRLRC